MFLSCNSYGAGADLKHAHEKNKFQTKFALNLGDKIALDDNKVTLKLFFKYNGVEYNTVRTIKPNEVLIVNLNPNAYNAYLIGFSVSFLINKIKFATNVLNYKFMVDRKFIIKFPFTNKEGEIKIENGYNNGINKLTIPAIGLIVENI